MKKYVIDACNLIFFDRTLFATYENHGFQQARMLLVSMLSRFASIEGLEQIIAVFDGSEKTAHHKHRHREAMGQVSLLFTSPRTDADHCIIEMIEDSKQPGQFTVVSNDKFIQRNVLKAGAHVMGCGNFLRTFRRRAEHAADPLRGEDPRKFHGISQREVEEWMRYFGFEEGKQG
jgi:predicted RNA-binding protein with PIN domain